MTQHKNNKILLNRAEKVIPGGVNSPVRSFAGVGGTPVFINRAKGSFLFDESGEKYIDYLGSWGPMIFGHACPPVLEAVKKQIENSSSFGLATTKETELAELMVSMVPGIEKVRLVNSGTEACMTAVRIARAVSGKNKIIKFNGCYHGHADTFLVKAGSGALTLGNPSSPGVSSETVKNTLVAEFNEIDSVKEIFSNHKNEIAAIIVEPVAGNMGCIAPEKEFLKELRKIADDNKTCLIFDEVMTGFRLAAGGAQELYNVEADLVTFGKIIGGGFPVGAVAGKIKWMDSLAPVEPVYQAGTLSGNPVATTAGITILTELKNNPEIYTGLDEKSKLLEKKITQKLNRFSVPFQINRVGSMISLFFSNKPVKTYSDVQQSNMKMFSAFFHEMLKNEVHLPPSGYESWFLATSITDEIIEKTALAVEKSIENINLKK